MDYSLSTDPVTDAEAQLLSADLVTLGVDSRVIAVLNGTLAAAGKGSAPKVVRAHRGGELAGVAFIIECRRLGGSMFDNRAIVGAIDLAGIPMFYWQRFGTAIDLVANPGFVAAGTDRVEFVSGALDFLQRRYLYGACLDEGLVPSEPGRFVALPFCDYGAVDLAALGSMEALFRERKSLRRKMNRFQNRGGVVEMVRGALPAPVAEACVACYESLTPMVRLPYQDMYAGMVKTMCGFDDSSVVHVLTKLAGEVVGFHSFVDSGDGLHVLSGAFHRERGAIHNAYDVMFAETIRNALALGKRVAYFGPVVNPTKQSMMNRFLPCHMKLVSRSRVVVFGLRQLIAASRLKPSMYRQYVGIGLPGSAATDPTPAAAAEA